MRWAQNCERAERWNLDTQVRAPRTRSQLCYHPRMTLRTAVKLVRSIAVALVSAVTGSGQRSRPELKAGDMAPAFDLPGSDGRTHRLADYRGKSAVVLAWFPKAFTGG